jgi:hypothetical protein
MFISGCKLFHDELYVVFKVITGLTLNDARLNGEDWSRGV